MESYIDEYNTKVREKCKDKIINKKIFDSISVATGRARYNPSLGGVVTPEPLSKDRFIREVKNMYTYLGEKPPPLPAMVKAYDGLFDMFSLDEFFALSEFMSAGGYTSLQEAFEDFIRLPNNQSLEVQVQTRFPSSLGELFQVTTLDELFSDFASISSDEPEDMEQFLESAEDELEALYARQRQREADETDLTTEQLAEQLGRDITVRQAQDLLDYNPLYDREGGFERPTAYARFEAQRMARGQPSMSESARERYETERRSREASVRSGQVGSFRPEVSYTGMRGRPEIMTVIGVDELRNKIAQEMRPFGGSTSLQGAGVSDLPSLMDLYSIPE